MIISQVFFNDCYAFFVNIFKFFKAYVLIPNSKLFTFPAIPKPFSAHQVDAPFINILRMHTWHDNRKLNVRILNRTRGRRGKYAKEKLASYALIPAENRSHTMQTHSAR